MGKIHVILIASGQTVTKSDKHEFRRSVRVRRNRTSSECYDRYGKKVSSQQLVLRAQVEGDEKRRSERLLDFVDERDRGHPSRQMKGRRDQFFRLELHTKLRANQVKTIDAGWYHKLG